MGINALIIFPRHGIYETKTNYEHIFIEIKLIEDSFQLLIFLLILVICFNNIHLAII